MDQFKNGRLEAIIKFNIVSSPQGGYITSLITLNVLKSKGGPYTNYEVVSASGELKKIQEWFNSVDKL